jgi:LuxR family maltose regulon positive regulatory protein
MPKVPTYTLAWSSATQVYELYQTRDRSMLNIALEGPEWFSWLEQISSFAFAGKSGHYTTRKEARQRGDRYWYAYLATGEHLTKKYLGKTADVTLARLEHIAGELSAHQAASVQRKQAAPLPPAQGEPLISLVATGAEDEVKTAPPRMLAQHHTPLPPPLATKLHVPRPRAHLVPRVHLVERLQRSVTGALTLVSAPAGFGKTTLLAQWLVQSSMPVAWLSLDAKDNDPTRFLASLIAALQTVDVQLGTTALTLLHTQRPPPPEAVLAVLTNDLAERGGGDVVLVLDDYHVITAELIQQGMRYLVEHLPPHLHLVLATRADPPFPLARLRAQGQLCEMRIADLRFADAEARTFLQAVMGLNLEAEAIAILESRTEGWIAGLQLAALSLHGRADVAAFLAAFTGSHRYVLDYLSEEVLARQDASVQQFLLHTSILERLSEPLCDAVTQQEGSQAMLEGLERANLFVVALDDERGWYRYHHLFAEVLRRHLQQREPTLVPELHQRASVWYEQHELPIEAVQHALAVPDVEHAVRLIEPIALPVASQGQNSTVLGWMNALPEALIRARPLLHVYYARLLTFANQLEEAEARLQEAEQGVQKEVSAEQAQSIMGFIISIRAGIALFSGDLPHAVSLAQQALEVLPETEMLPRVGALVSTIHAYLVSGDVTPESEREVATADALIRVSGNLVGAVHSITLLAHLHVLQGRLRQAAATYAQVVQVVPRPEVLQTFFVSPFYYFGLGDLLREWNDLEAAEHHLSQGMALVKETLTVEPFVAILGYTALAHLEQARGNAREAIATLDALASLARQRHFPAHLMSQVAAARAQLELAQGNVATAIHWADTSGLSPEDDELSYPREGEYLTLVRVRTTQAHEDPAKLFLRGALHLLDRLLQDAEVKARLGSVLKILIVRALALEAQGNRTAALSTLERALLLAAPEGYMRLFVDEGAPMLALLREIQAQSRVPGYVATLLSAFGEEHLSHPASANSSVLVEPLTTREREVLHLLSTGASNGEIARRLVVSVGTVKRHVSNICGKLGVHNRTQAVARARILHLL